MRARGGEDGGKLNVAPNLAGVATEKKAVKSATQSKELLSNVAEGGGKRRGASRFGEKKISWDSIGELVEAYWVVLRFKTRHKKKNVDTMRLEGMEGGTRSAKKTQNQLKDGTEGHQQRIYEKKGGERIQTF